MTRLIKYIDERKGRSQSSLCYPLNKSALAFKISSNNVTSVTSFLFLNNDKVQIYTKKSSGFKLSCCFILPDVLTKTPI